MCEQRRRAREEADNQERHDTTLSSHRDSFTTGNSSQLDATVSRIRNIRPSSFGTIHLFCAGEKRFWTSAPVREVEKVATSGGWYIQPHPEESLLKYTVPAAALFLVASLGASLDAHHSPSAIFDMSK